MTSLVASNNWWLGCLYEKNQKTLLLSIWLYLLTLLMPEVFAMAAKHRYLVLHQYDDGTMHDSDPFRHVGDITNAERKNLMGIGKKRFVSIKLTEKEAADIKKELSGKNGLIELDNVIQLPLKPYVNNSNLQQNDGEFLNNTPLCNATVDNVDFYVLDTLVFPDTVELSNVKLIYGPNYVNDPVACHPHGTWVSSIIAGKTSGVIPNGMRIIYNMVVLDCNGNGFPSYIIQAFSAVIENAKLNALQGRRAVVNLSAGAGTNLVLDAAANAVINAGISLFVSAGNDGINACVSQSPAEAANVFTVAATEFPGNVPASFTNWGLPGDCVKLFLPGLGVTVASITDSGAVTFLAGTSFATPTATALAAMQLAEDPKATPAEVSSRILARSINVMPIANNVYNNLMPIMQASQACFNTNLLFSSFTTSKSTSNKFTLWYSGMTQGNFCVMFKAASVRNTILLGLRYNISTPASEIVQVKIGVPHKPGFLSTIQQGGKVLSSKITNNRILSTTPTTTIRVAEQAKIITVAYSKKLRYDDPVAFGCNI